MVILTPDKFVKTFAPPDALKEGFVQEYPELDPVVLSSQLLDPVETATHPVLFIGFCATVPKLSLVKMVCPMLKIEAITNTINK